MNKVLCFLGVFPLLTGCAVPASHDYMASEAYRARQGLAESLFPSDQAVLSTEAIEKILSSKITLPTRGRIAVLNFGQRRYWYGWSDDLLGAPEESLLPLLDKLRSSGRVADASVLPSLLVPEKQTVPYLREAAARYQADLLLIYRSRVYSTAKAKFLAPDEFMANCSIEAVLLDTRTGTVPCTALATGTCVTKQKKEDFDKMQTTQRAEREAQADAFGKLGDKVIAFLDAVLGPTGQTTAEQSPAAPASVTVPAGVKYETKEK